MFCSSEPVESEHVHRPTRTTSNILTNSRFLDVAVELAAAAVADLHLVADEQNIAFLAARLARRDERLGERDNAALALHAFDDDGARFPVSHAADILHIRFGIVHLGHEGSEPMMEGFLPRRREREERSAVEAVFERDDLCALSLAVLHRGVLSCRFEGALVGFRAGICKERAFCARLGAQELGKPALRFGVIIVADVLYAAELFDDRSLPRLIVDAENIRRDARAEVDVFFSLRRNERGVFSADKGNGEVRVRFGVVFFVQFLYLGKIHHSKTPKS